MTRISFLLVFSVIFADVSTGLLTTETIRFGSRSSLRSFRRADSGVVAAPFHLSERTNDGASAKTIRPLLAGAVALPFPGVPRKMLYVAVSLLAATTVIRRRRDIFYPGSSPDPDFNEPLPPGAIDGCPFVGPLSMFGGFDEFFLERSKSLGKSSLFKLYSFGRPSVMVAGSKRIKSLLDREFRASPAAGPGQVNQVAIIGNSDMLLGKDSLQSVTESKEEYKSFQRLVGQSMSPKALSEAMPALQKAAECSIKSMTDSEGSVKAVDVFHKFTMDIAWRQIVGLDLKTENEIETFIEELQTWSNGIVNYVLWFLPRFVIKLSKPYRAKVYLTDLIQRKIEQLEQNGPDESTLSGMVFAIDDSENIVDADVSSDSHNAKRLTKKQIIDNCLLLFVAGSETSSNTLTNIIYMMGKNRRVWEKLVEEQNKVMSAHGSELTKKIIDQECPYLEAVIKESMRILSVSGGGVRTVDQTVTIDGTQIPKNWVAWYGIGLTHALDPVTWTEDESHMDPVKGFKPERWLKAETTPKEYLPFGAGFRFCLGYGLALAEMKTYLAVMARTVDFTLMEKNGTKTKWKEGFIRTPKDGVPIEVVSLKQEDTLSPDKVVDIEGLILRTIENDKDGSKSTMADEVVL